MRNLFKKEYGEKDILNILRMLKLLLGPRIIDIAIYPSSYPNGELLLIIYYKYMQWHHATNNAVLRMLRNYFGHDSIIKVEGECGEMAYFLRVYFEAQMDKKSMKYRYWSDSFGTDR